MCTGSSASQLMHVPVMFRTLGAPIDRLAVACRDAESIAGWKGSHGRKKRTLGHIRAILARARATRKVAGLSVLP